MRLIDSSVSLIDTVNPFIKIEKVGRTCYKSESDFTLSSAKLFYNSLVKRQHTAMLEHATFVFQMSEYAYYNLCGNKYLNFSIEELEDGNERYLVSGNLRAINEIQDDILLYTLFVVDKDLVYNQYVREFLENSTFTVSPNVCKLVNIDEIPDIQEHAYKKHKYLSFHFVCDRGVTHEMVRHRPSSYAQESTRYCNYSKDKFGNEITCIKPAGYDSWSDKQKWLLVKSFESSERAYFDLLDTGLTPQQARAVLPTDLKTEIVMTANLEEFTHFFNLRSLGTTGAPHPDMKVVADMALALCLSNTKQFIK